MKKAGESSLGKSFRIKYDLDSLLADSSNDEKWMKDKKLKIREVNFGSQSKRKTLSAKICNGNLELKKNSETDGPGRFSSLKNYSNEKSKKENDILAKVTRKISRIYTTRLGALLERQRIELDDFKRSFVVDLENELEEWERCFAFLKHQEEKLYKILVKLRDYLNSSEMQNQKVKIIKGKHEAFARKYVVMMNMHWSEIISMKDSIEKEISEVGKRYFGDRSEI